MAMFVFKISAIAERTPENTPFGSTGIGTVSHLEGTTRRQRPVEEDLGNLKMLTSTIDVLTAAETGDPAEYRTMLDENCYSRDAASHV